MRSRPSPRVGPSRAIPTLFCLSLATAVATGGLAAVGADDPATQLTRRARAFLASLEPAQHEDVAYAFDDDERFDLRLAPLFLEGLPMSRMNPKQSALLMDVLGAGLSEAGLEKVRTIVSLEREVERQDREAGGLRWFQHLLRDPERYYAAIFGDPEAAAEGEPWGFRFEGHHVSLNWTVVGREPVAVTPLFLGSQPARVPDGWQRAGLRVLGAEENLARELYASMDPVQREYASLPFGANRGLFHGDGRRVEPVAPDRGLARRSMVPGQRALLDALLDVHLGNFAEPIAASHRAEIDAAGRDRIRFSWAGSAEPGEPHYYRIQGPSFLIEFDNSESDADHVHVVWRSFDGDFGIDALARHRAAAHSGP